jgi:hypothetical protein
MSDEKIRVYVVSGGPQDLGELYLESIQEVAEMIKVDCEETPESEVEEQEWTITVKLMTREELEALPEYEF